MSLQKIDNLGFLRGIKILKCSENEMRALTGRESITEAIDKVRGYGVEVVIATMGERGSLVSFGNQLYMVPSARSKVILDPTGAGDVFIGAFITEYLRNADPLWCTCVGAAAASFVIEKIGPKGFKGNREIYRRAAPIYEKTLKLQL
jgi:sugar/nucleoside kinase (ribokinase family)